MIPLFDLKRVIAPYEENLKKVFDKCLKTGHFINGPEIKTFEQQMATYLQSPHVVGVSSGTDALLSIFMALEFEPGDEILVTPFTFISSATSIMRAGLKPVFVDLAPDSFHPSIKQYEQALSSRTKGILVVHLFGEPNNMEKLKDFCSDTNLLLVEDCAQAMGSYWEDKAVGTYGIASAFSFFPAKNLGCFGDGGAVATDSEVIAERIQTIRAHGALTKYNTAILGGNFRLDTLQASILSVLLPNLDEWITQRRSNAEFYSNHLKNIKGITPPPNIEGHSWNQYTLRVQNRDELKAFLDKKGIGSAIYYPVPLHRQPLLYTPRYLPNVEIRCKEVISIPIYPGLLPQEREDIVQNIKTFMEER